MSCAERFLRFFVFEILLFDHNNVMLALVWCVRLRWFLLYTVPSLSWDTNPNQRALLSASASDDAFIFGVLRPVRAWRS